MANGYNHGEVVLRFTDVSFAYNSRRPILNEVGFSVRARAKITLMGQNGAGKSTIFKLITGELRPEEGAVHVANGATIAEARQALQRADYEKTVEEFFGGAFPHKVYDLEPKVKKVLEVVNLAAPYHRKIGTFSGGQQARLLLAFALIQNPDILLLDEPTNNLDAVGIAHLTQFLIDYPKTVLVISHDAAFLNAFTHGVLYLDSHMHAIEQYAGDYLKVVEEIKARIERERRENARLEADIANRKDQMNFFAQKGGHMRDVARKMREAIEELEAQLVAVRQEDKTIAPFTIPCPEISGPAITISSVSYFKNGKPANKKVRVTLKRGEVLLVTGPNGSGKTTFLRSIARGARKDIELGDGVEIGYYAQDFSALDDGQTGYDTLAACMKNGSDEDLRAAAARFLITDAVLRTRVGDMSEGQKGLLCFAAFLLMKPSLLVMDEPTNHINFRHLPVIARALDEYRGALILVSHMQEFVDRIKIDQTLDIGSF